MNFYQFSDFEVGQIYKMSVAERSHVRNPYYVEIIEVNENKEYIVTNIPGHHSLKIFKGNNWKYQTDRMTYVGMNYDFGHLLLNQNIQHKK